MDYFFLKIRSIYLFTNPPIYWRGTVVSVVQWLGHLFAVWKVPRSKSLLIRYAKNSLCTPSSKWVPDSLQSQGREGLGGKGRGDGPTLYMLCSLILVNPNIHCTFGQHLPFTTNGVLKEHKIFAKFSSLFVVIIYIEYSFVERINHSPT